jgi:hypothetical protein
VHGPTETLVHQWMQSIVRVFGPQP